MLLGGQHIAAACLWMRKKLLKDNPNMQDKNLPEAYQCVRGVVLRVDTPRRALISAAGYHQSTQQDSVACTMGDVMKMMGRYSAEKQVRGRGAQLADEEVMACLSAMGFDRGNEELLHGTSKTEMSLDKAMMLAEKSVCPSHFSLRNVER